MHQYLLKLLTTLEAAIPPAHGCHHALVAFEYGSAEDGWEDRLGVSLSRANGSFQTLFFDRGDFEKEPTELASAVVVAAECLP